MINVFNKLRLIELALLYVLFVIQLCTAQYIYISLHIKTKQQHVICIRDNQQLQDIRSMSLHNTAFAVIMLLFITLFVLHSKQYAVLHKNLPQFSRRSTAKNNNNRE